MRKLAVAVLVLAVSTCVSLAQGGYYNVHRDVFGNTNYQFGGGYSAQLSPANVFGQRTLSYSNGYSVQYERPDMFGNVRYNVRTMPIQRGW
jgi:hypothetical protein